MTAATPPACCAVADNGKIHPQPCLFGHDDRGAFADADTGADRSRIRAKSVTVAESLALAKSVAKPNSNTQPISESDTNINTDRL
jgi:hypothetical protein